MKAVVTNGYGSIDVLDIKDIEKPKISDEEILVRVQVCSVNPIDWKIRSGQIKMLSGSKPPKVLGGDFSGIVEATGKNVKKFAKGDEVWGHISAFKGGAYAEYIKVKTEDISLKPSGFSFTEAAAIPLAGLTAYQSLVYLGKIKANDKILINGCTGGVGNIAVQIAKFLGCEVTGICSTKNIDYAKKIGVDVVIDYTKDDILKQDEMFDSVYDFVGNLSFSQSQKMMKDRGIFVTALPSIFAFMFADIINFFRSKKSKNILVKSSKDDLEALKNIAESDALIATIEKVFPLEDVKKAHTLSESGRVVGKVVMLVD